MDSFGRVAVTCSSSSGGDFQEQLQRLIHRYRSTGMPPEQDDAVPNLCSLLQRAYWHTHRPAHNLDEFSSHPPSFASLPPMHSLGPGLAVEPLSLAEILARALELTDPMTEISLATSILSSEEEEESEEGPERSPSQAPPAAHASSGNHGIGDSRDSAQ